LLKRIQVCTLAWVAGEREGRESIGEKGEKGEREGRGNVFRFWLTESRTNTKHTSTKQKAKPPKKRHRTNTDREV